MRGDEGVVAGGSPHVENVCLTDVIIRHGATEVPLPVLDVRLAVKYLYEVVIAVVGHLEVVLWELEVNVLPLLRPDDPGAVHGHVVGPGVVEVLRRDVGAACQPKNNEVPADSPTDLTYQVHGASVFKLALRYEGNVLKWVGNEVVHGFEPLVLDRAVRHKPAVGVMRRGGR